MEPHRVGLLTISDGCARGQREDLSGKVLADETSAAGYSFARQGVVPDDADTIAETLTTWCADCDLILTTGGTGFAPRDVTPEATTSVIERPAPGIAELLRAEGLRHNARAALSRGIAGIRGRTLIVNLPGSPKAVAEGLQVLLPLLPHALALLLEEPVDH